MKLTEAENRELAGYLGIKWCECKLSADQGWLICACGERFSQLNAMQGLADQHIYDNNPNFSDARVVLREMRKREDWPEFFCCILGDSIRGADSAICVLTFNLFLGTFVLDDTGLLAKAALEWLRKEKDRKG